MVKRIFYASLFVSVIFSEVTVLLWNEEYETPHFLAGVSSDINHPFEGKEAAVSFVCVAFFQNLSDICRVCEMGVLLSPEQIRGS